MLGDRKRKPIGIDFLKSIGTDHLARDLRGDCNQRNRIEFRIRDGGEQIGRPRTRGPEAYRGATARPRHALGDKAGALLVTREDVAKSALPQRVVERKIRASGDSRNDADAMTLQGLDHELGAVEFHGSSPHSDCSLRDGWTARWLKNETPAGHRASRGFESYLLIPRLRRGGLGNDDYDDDKKQAGNSAVEDQVVARVVGKH